MNARATEIEHVGAVAQRAHIHLRAGYKWGDCPPPRPLPLQQVDIHAKNYNFTDTHSGFSLKFEFSKNGHFKGVLAIYSIFAINIQITSKINKTPLK